MPRVYNIDVASAARDPGLVAHPPEGFFRILDGKLVGQGLGTNQFVVSPSGGWKDGLLLSRLSDGRMLMLASAVDDDADGPLWTLTTTGEGVPLRWPTGESVAKAPFTSHLDSGDTILTWFVDEPGKPRSHLFGQLRRNSNEVHVLPSSTSLAGDRPWFYETQSGLLFAEQRPSSLSVSTNNPITTASVQAPYGGAVRGDDRRARVLTWRVSAQCAASMISFSPRLRVLIDGRETPDIAQTKYPLVRSLAGEDGDEVEVEAQVLLAKRGAYTIELLVDSPTQGVGVRLGPSVSGTIDWNLGDYVTANWKVASLIAAVVPTVSYSLLWVLLFLLAPRWERGRHLLVAAPALQGVTALGSSGLCFRPGAHSSAVLC